MPAYSFKERFVPLILDGSKRQTIRKARQGRSAHAVPGKPVYLYFGMRTKWCRKLAEAICTRAVPIHISETGQIFVDSKIVVDRDAFAWADGFRPEGTTAENPAGAYDLMISWWKATHDLPFHGVIIYWDKLKVNDK